MKLCKVVSYYHVVPFLMAPLKPPTNFKFKHFFSFLTRHLFLLNIFLHKQQIHAPSKQHASLSQDGERSLSIAKGVSSSSIASGVEEHVLLTIDPTCPKPKKT
jgi:hypothetical protein